jgi:hypothetical protein
MSTTTENLHTALLKVQAELPTLPKDATNPHFRSRYTPLDTIVERVGPILTRHGLTWITKPSISDTGDPSLIYRLTHAASGQLEEGEMALMLSKNDAQGQGAALTYARRYALSAVLNIVSDEDVDGNDVQAVATPSRKIKGTTLPKPDPAAKLTDRQVKGLASRLTDVDPKKVQVALLARGVNDLPELTMPQAVELLKELGA